MVTVIVGALASAMLVYALLLMRAALRAGQLGIKAETAVLGAVTNFFDTLGIGSFAPTIAWFRLRKLVPDRLIPLTTLAGYILPALLQGVIFLILLGVQVDPWLLIACVAAMVTGGLLSPGLAARSPIRLVQTVVGVALLLAAFFYTLGNLGLMPAGGTATSLPFDKAAIVVSAHFVFGLLIAFGVGNFAPTLALLSLLGMDPRLAFPIMATAAGASGVAAAARSFRLIDFDYRIVLSLALGAIPAVLVAAFLVKEMPLTTLRWLVVAVVTYTGVTLLWAATRREKPPQEELIARAVID